MDKIELQVAYGAVKHFGRNLYTSNPPAVAELVANAWDAYATECNIYNINNELFIIDNGIGMTDHELKTRYAVSGYEKEKDDIRVPNHMSQRPYMGRKGIGKFSAFSLGESYILYTKSDEDEEWKAVTFKYEDLLVNEPTVELDVQRIDNIVYHFEDYDIKLFENLESGSIIHIPDLKRKFIKTTTNNLKNILSRRFSVNISQRYNFNLIINDEKVDLKSHFYDEHIEFIYYFNMDIKEIKERFSSAEENYIKKIEDKNFLNENNVSGWIGTVSEIKNLKIEEELNSGGVIIYINNKLADENILSTVQNAGMPNSYVIGEVNADFLENEEEDPVLSSREGLNLEVENVSKLRMDLSEIRNDLVNQWNKLRASRKDEKQNYLQRILEDDNYQYIYINIFNKEQRNKLKSLAQKLFDNNQVNSDADYKYYTPVLFSVVNSEIIEKISVEESDEFGKMISKFYDLFEKTDINNALRIQAHIKDRLKVIDQLSKNIDQEAVEKVFENQLATNPWLINPFYDKARNHTIIETQTHYKSIINNNKVDGYADIIIRAADKPIPIVIELKREKKTSYSAPKATEIINQINQYRRAIIDNETEKGNPYTPTSTIDVEAYFICGKDALNKLSPLDRNDIEVVNKIKIHTYDSLISSAKGMYLETLDDELVLSMEK